MSDNEDELPVMSAKIAPGAFMTVDFRGRRDMDPEVCVGHGGHCWKRDGMVTAGSVPTYTEYCLVRADVPGRDVSEPYVRAVIAAQDARTGLTVYQYGWAESVTREFESERDPQHTTTVEWAGAYRTTTVWPGPEDFPEQPAELGGKRELTT